ncbi:flavin monoamine oxidase family protein [Dasania marina]|uniref:flavin monoamine oxidase family protein n=1 Tax=Dasania marina TaxID=471499 RepID=UPI000380C050|nr:NAD(P)/FAD-dependent oxidoreductase [Dasania marina]
MAYSPISKIISKIIHVGESGQQQGIPLKEALEIHDEQALILAKQQKQQQLENQDRRNFLQKTGVAAAVATVAAGGILSPLSAKAQGGPPSSSDPRVAVIGAGLAGLRCAHRLNKLGSGFNISVYEASTRLGGRCYTARGYFDDGQITEWGGEFINTSQTEIRNLAHKLGLTLDDEHASPPDGKQWMGYVDGQYYTESQIGSDWDIELILTLNNALQAAPNPGQVTYENYNAEHLRLDNMLAADWMDEIGLGRNSSIGRLMLGLGVSELGVDPNEQSALNMLGIMGTRPQPAAERFRIRGGADQLITGMEQELPSGTVVTDKALTAIQGDSNGPYTLSFNDGSSAVCDALVLALPFTTLRDVDIAPAIWNAFRPQKRQAINELGMGHNAKVQVQCNSRTWHNPINVGGEIISCNGSTLTDPDSHIVSWDPTSNQAGSKGVLANYLGGSKGLNLSSTQPFQVSHANDVSNFLNSVNNVFPGTAAAFNGKALTSDWTINPWSKGSYSSFWQGQYTSFGGAPAKPEGNIFFAGEHTDSKDHGYLNGAVRSGERAAIEVLHTFY